MLLKAKDIARELGLSPATVSLVINNKPGVGAETRKQIMDKIAELKCEYLLESSAKSARREDGAHNDSLPTLAFVLYIKGGELMEQTPFFPYMISGIENTARLNGYNLAIVSVMANQDDQAKRDVILNSDCVGFVVFATEIDDESDITLFESLKLPFVILDNYFPDRNLTCVTLNNEQGIQKLIRHLLRYGHRKIGFLDSGLPIPSFVERREYCKRILHNAGIVDSERVSYSIGYPVMNAFTGMKNVLAQGGELATAYLADNDIVAIGAIEALKENGYQIPGDLSIVGFDDRPDCLTCSPKLTTIHIRRASFGAEAIELLVSQLERLRSNRSIVRSKKLELGVELVTRESSGPAKKEE